MANTKKLTKKDYFNQLLTIEAVAANEALVAFIKNELNLLVKKNENKKPTAQQTANAEICQAIIDTMEDDKLYTITDLIKTVPACATLSNQRVSALVRQMIDVKVERVVEKRTAYFRKLASVDEYAE